MPSSRRDFLKKASLLAAGSAFPSSIRKALAIDPAPGSTFLDAEHVVILMQENRSFDHVYGTLRGVRGFSDPRAITLPDGNPVWLQTNRDGETYAPFRLNLKESRSTWMDCLPHGREDQYEARNGGHHDRWLQAKASGIRDYARMPLTLGYHTREDLPFYHDLADAFTICDQNFCSALTSTTPNRLYLWSGTIRPDGAPHSRACIRNADADDQTEISWTTFPERLEDLGIPWRVYQNEITIPTGFTGPEESWLANFGDNPLEYFSQFHPRLHPPHLRYAQERVRKLQEWHDNLLQFTGPLTTEEQAAFDRSRRSLEESIRYRDALAGRSLEQLPPRERSLHLRAFTTNQAHADFRQLVSLEYDMAGQARKMNVPKGDLFHQFREDVRNGTLPVVSYLVAPEKFSDHPAAPWYGAWYLAEAFDALTSNPDVWKKTIFILCYDENDGYFDHVTPFVPPEPRNPRSGRMSPGLDSVVEWVTAEQEADWVARYPRAGAAPGAIGLGYRVPLVIASPWSRGGHVCSQVFDHTSMIQFLEKFLSHKAGKAVVEPNISAWRRAICGDLTSVFRPWNGEAVPLPPRVPRDAFMESIHQAQFRDAPGGFKKLEPAEIELARSSPAAAAVLPRQEKGTRPSCALPYELAVQGARTPDGSGFAISFAAGNKAFGARSAGAPFHVYAPGSRQQQPDPLPEKDLAPRFYAVVAGDHISDEWSFDEFPEGVCHLRVHGPNGFFREFRSTASDPDLAISFESALVAGKPVSNATLRIESRGSSRELTVFIEDPTYGVPLRTVKLESSDKSGSSVTLEYDFAANSGWHDLLITVAGYPNFLQRFAGRVECGAESISDPAIGRA